MTSLETIVSIAPSSRSNTERTIFIECTLDFHKIKAENGNLEAIRDEIWMKSKDEVLNRLKEGVTNEQTLLNATNQPAFVKPTPVVVVQEKVIIPEPEPEPAKIEIKKAEKNVVQVADDA